MPVTVCFSLILSSFQLLCCCVYFLCGFFHCLLVFLFFFASHVINIKDSKDFSKDQDPVHSVLKGENRKIRAGLLS